MNHIESATTMLASRDAQCNALSVRPTNATSVGNTAVLLPVGKTAVLLPEVVVVRRELLLASWHLASLCSLFTAIPAAGRNLTACCWHYGNTMRSLSSTVTAGITYSGRD